MIITTDELAGVLDNKDLIIIDVRPVDAYNGWSLKGEKRGGHIRGARSLPLKWTKYIDWIEIVRSKGILPGHSLVLYGYNHEESEHVAQLFIRAGYQNLKIYNGFLNEWSAVDEYPMEHLERFSNLVPAGWLNDIISGRKPASYSGRGIVICHAHYRNHEDYMKGHIPGAISFDTLNLESPETWNRRSPEEIRKALTEHGICKDTTVVLYGRFSFPDNNDPFPGSSAGHLGAIRCAALMLYAGVRDVRVLNGGLQSWEDEGYSITTEESLPLPVGDFGLDIPGQKELVIDTPEAKKYLEDKDSDLVCVRSWNEWIGEVSGYNYIEKKGRIPGALFANCGSDAYHMENYRNLDHTTREYNEIAETWEKSGIVKVKKLAFYCGTGWRGSEAFLNAWLMGWPYVSVYDGGWFEWSSDEANPVETGIPNEIQVDV